MGVESVVNTAEMRRRAIRRLPKLLGDWLEGGAEDELGIVRSLEQFHRYCLLPHYLVDVSTIDTAVRLFDRTYDIPLGIAPTGYPGLFWPGADMALARAAVDQNVPYIMSGHATATVENAAKAAPEHCWFQLYPAKDPDITRDIVARAADAGLETLVVTVDVPTEPKRERDLRNKFEMPMRMRPSVILDGLLHPFWTARYLGAGGLPTMANWAPYAREGADATAVALFAEAQGCPTVSWADLEEIRTNWPGKLVLKGVLSGDDARQAADKGVDGLIVSNHGGRESDRLPAPLDVLPHVLEAAPDLSVMVDGGIRRGADIVTALCLGARFVFVGRPIVYGLTVNGCEGVKRALAILQDEMVTTMRQIGRTSVSDLDRSVVYDTHAVSHDGSVRASNRSQGTWE